MDNKKNDNNKGSVILSLIVITIMLLIPLMITFVVYKIIMFVFPSLLFTAGNLITLYAIVAVLILAAIMAIATKRSKKGIVLNAKLV